MSLPSAPRVLLVEDEPLIRMLTTDMLDTLGFVALEAGTGAEALAIDERDLADLAGLVIDLGLPDYSGEEVARQLRRRRPDLPVILTTGADASDALARLVGGGPVVSLEKPYQFSELEQAAGILKTAAGNVA
ncbi:MAG: response regulator [Caulobacteraceae bacterium]